MTKKRKNKSVVGRAIGCQTLEAEEPVATATIVGDTTFMEELLVDERAAIENACQRSNETAVQAANAARAAAQAATAATRTLNSIHNQTQSGHSATAMDPTVLGAAIASALKTSTTAERIPAPKFKGVGNVEVFYQQFDQVAEMNNWSAAARLIHLRNSLDGPAQVCADGESEAEILASLLSRYGITRGQAREKLSRLERQKNQSYYDFAVEVDRLCGKAFPGEIVDREKMENLLEYFGKGMKDGGLYRFLHACKPRDITELVAATERYYGSASLGTGVSNRPTCPTSVNAAGVGDLVAEQPLRNTSNQQSRQAGTAGVTPVHQGGSGLERIESLLEQLLKKLDMRNPTPARGGYAGRGANGPCWSCGGPHMQKNCPSTRQSQNPASNNRGRGRGRGNPSGMTLN